MLIEKWPRKMGAAYPALLSVENRPHKTDEAHRAVMLVEAVMSVDMVWLIVDEPHSGAM